MSTALALVGIPVYIIWALIALFSVEHWRYQYNNVFQGIYLRAVLIFGVVSLFMFMGGFDESLVKWLQFLLSFVEGYVFSLFFGILVLWGWCRGDVHAALMRSNATRTRFYWRGKHWGKEYKDGESALRSYMLQSLTLMIVYPCLSLFEAMWAEYFGKRLPFLARFFGIGGVLCVGLIIGLQCLVRLYLALAGCRCGKEERSENLLEGLEFMRKFAVVKFWLWCIVFNSMVFEPLVINGTLPFPQWACSDLDLPNQVGTCHARYLSFILNWEGVIFTICCGYVFRPHNLLSLPNRRAYCSPYNTFFYTLLRVVCFWDCYILWRCAPAAVEPKSDSVPEIKVARETPASMV
jgi:hypothetical protein